MNSEVKHNASLTNVVLLWLLIRSSPCRGGARSGYDAVGTCRDTTGCLPAKVLSNSTNVEGWNEHVTLPLLHFQAIRCVYPMPIGREDKHAYMYNKQRRYCNSIQRVGSAGQGHSPCHTANRRRENPPWAIPCGREMDPSLQHGCQRRRGCIRETGG